MQVVQPTLPGIGPPECDEHTFRKRWWPMGRRWRECEVCWVGVFTAKRRKR